MTAENCGGFERLDTYVEEPTIQSRLMFLFKWLKSIFELITKLFRDKISF